MGVFTAIGNKNRPDATQIQIMFEVDDALYLSFYHVTVHQ